ncbi:class I SAM-dependent methyltransferase [Planctomicrobium piriforme]|uniref:Methyltransferase domain-containing protein n=1 Tax=Planctomicrobium piriforme TaxID=1576369 RepID=A0A1I3C849_9PLAN|nr:class I SAM-dependent methyltransferase [Planctomicrobium piriforme]SFH70740.1 Methyltransferase domain-containing protein [Planctomicrobium piriforme]
MNSDDPAAERDARYSQASDVFRRGWSLYQKIVNNNDMRHVEMGRTLTQLLQQRPGPFSLLDLGCGDASMAAGSLKDLPVSRYTGVELVPAAAALADQNLDGVVADRGFVIGNLIDAVRDPVLPRYDVVLASYSVHHLSRQEKEELFRDVKTHLADGGMFILIDLVRLDGESRDEYMDRFHEFAERTFSVLDAEEKQAVREHMNSSDWPEARSTLRQLAHDGGFASMAEHYHDEAGFYACFTFTPSSLD